MTSLDQTVFDNSSGEPSSTGRDGLDAEAATAANLLSGLAARLRAAYERGVDIAELAAASHQSASEVRQLLRLAGVDVLVDGQDPPGAPTDPARSTHDPQQLRRVRRPTPSRRLSRLHPRIEPETTGPSGLAEPEPSGGQPSGRVPAGRVPAASERAAVPPPVTPLGILIGASAGYSEPPTQPESRRPRRVAARAVRVGRGTSLVVLPSWRAAIAVSVPTELLLSETGLGLDQLTDAHLTVLMNPDALHDRELELHDWQSELSGRRVRPGAGRTEDRPG